MLVSSHTLWGCRGRDRMVIGLISTYAISAYFLKDYEFESRAWQGVLDTTLCSLSVTCDRSVVFSWYSGVLH